VVTSVWIATLVTVMTHVTFMRWLSMFPVLLSKQGNISMK